VCSRISLGGGSLPTLLSGVHNVLACGCFLDKRILPNLICISSLPVMSGYSGDIDGKQVDFNDMIIVIVKCFNYSRMNGCESD